MLRHRTRERVEERHAAGGLAITAGHMERYRDVFEPPTSEELAMYLPPLVGSGWHTA